MYILILFIPFLNIFLNNRFLGLSSPYFTISLMIIQLIIVGIILYENTDTIIN